MNGRRTRRGRAREGLAAPVIGVSGISADNGGRRAERAGRYH